ncbi:hypothetical protein PSECIP111951_02623 [Pseudoalteromonas holothuriae]|uniref:UPF0056 membrane protein n=1 Tax=Pseudoalteromonas holothuriae TaxID=2963714 RepID=A0A9W4R3S2_9GAMM|nr:MULTISPECIES: MarC family protein [unclassified Pseudoalteromonas]CAH9062097.1 hypothetical protein PSECIP111951_02623 [Pseudoalteromonas sp. CIP111951]CAH9065778.1 hypothetical protein PSECIP111854_03752 [Pseudoalteromonas sp. CIP111854]
MDSPFLQNIIFFFAAIDPVGTIPIFLAVSAHLRQREKVFMAIQATLISAVVLVFFVIGGELILTASAIPLSAFQIAGGSILFIFALTMVFGDAKPESELKSLQGHSHSSVFPLAIPSIASPGAMLAAVILTEKDRFNIQEQLVTTLSMLVVLAMTLALMLISLFFSKKIGPQGAAVISRVMGIIVASLAVTHILTGIKAFFNLA